MADEIQRGRRIAHIDWMRGLACLLMFQTHCYNSWLSPQAKKSALYGWSQLGGTLPAPLFIFLAGLSVALVTERCAARGWIAERLRGNACCAEGKFSAWPSCSAFKNTRWGFRTRRGRICCAWMC